MGTLFHQHISSPVGQLTLIADGTHLTGLFLEGQRHLPDLSAAIQDDRLPVLRQTCLWLERYFHGGRPAPQELPLAPAGSTYQLAIWQLLLQIPYGSTITYGELAQRHAIHSCGTPCAQAAGNAVGRNPIPIIIPCHRIIGAHHIIGGYNGGVEVKRFLLSLEGIHL